MPGTIWEGNYHNWKDEKPSIYTTEETTGFILYGDVGEEGQYLAADDCLRFVGEGCRSYGTYTGSSTIL